jgi:hypothetical protein
MKTSHQQEMSSNKKKVKLWNINMMTKLNKCKEDWPQINCKKTMVSKTEMKIMVKIEIWMMVKVAANSRRMKI